MSEWKDTNLGFVLSFLTKGTTPPKGEGFVERNGINYIKSESISYNGQIDTTKFVQIDEETHHKFKRSQIQEEDILFSMAGAFLGKNAVVPAKILPANTNQALAILRVNKSVASPYFVSYCLRNPSMVSYVNSMTAQSAQPNINFQEISSLPLRIPALPTQKAIAEILSSLDDKIELNNQINQNLEALAQALFKQWFVDFEFPNENGEPYKSSGGEMIDSELGEIPKGWEVVAFKETVSKFIDNRGKTPPTIDEGIPLVEVKHLLENSIFPSLNTQKYVSEDVYKNWLRAQLQEDDILMSTVGTIGRLNITPKNETFAIAQNVLGIRFKKEVVNQIFMFCFMRSKIFNDEVNSRLITTVQASIKRSDIEKIPVLLPPLALLGFFEKDIQPFFNQILNLTKEIENLKKLRDTLLPKLISGELEVSEVNLEPTL